MVEILRDYRLLLKDRTLLAHIAIVSTSYAGLFAWISGSPFVLQELHGLSALEFGFAFGLACIGSVFGGCRPECGWNLRVAISSDVKLSDCRFAFKQLPGREGEPLGSPLVSFSRGVRYLSTPFLSVSITRQDLSVDR
jgi:DHA1 family bicyclomycin/chloramphenicol resistance-like MFS transporter